MGAQPLQGLQLCSVEHSGGMKPSGGVEHSSNTGDSGIIGDLGTAGDLGLVGDSGPVGDSGTPRDSGTSDGENVESSGGGRVATSSGDGVETPGGDLRLASDVGPTANEKPSTNVRLSLVSVKCKEEQWEAFLLDPLGRNMGSIIRDPLWDTKSTFRGELLDLGGKMRGILQDLFRDTKNRWIVAATPHQDKGRSRWQGRVSGPDLGLTSAPLMTVL